MPTAATSINPPFPFFGSKRNATRNVWRALGDPGTYIEPFAGSLAVLLGRETEPGVEIVVDSDGLIINFWRTLKHYARRYGERWDEQMALDIGLPTSTLSFSADNLSVVAGPLSEDDIEARHRYLVEHADEIRSSLRTRDDWFNAKAAFYWWQGQSAWLGSGWCRARTPDEVRRQRPHIDRTLKGMYAVGMTDERIIQLGGRLSNVTILSGDWADAWTRPITTSILTRLSRGGVGVFLDPPYTHDTNRAAGLYRDDGSLSDDVFTWCVDHGDTPDVRVVLAGYRSEYDALESAHGWRVIEWTRPNGYAPESNRRRDQDVLFISPYCYGGTRNAS